MARPKIHKVNEYKELSQTKLDQEQCIFVNQSIYNLLPATLQSVTFFRLKFICMFCITKISICIEL